MQRTKMMSRSLERLREFYESRNEPAKLRDIEDDLIEHYEGILEVHLNSREITSSRSTTTILI
jgi:hypothetical protein